MLKLSHLTKIYKTKGGAEVRALDDVSLSFEETGLVFLLGKSGSGKSTLLNVAGGLDEPTEGEVVVFGKSSKDFSGQDFDSYRNTYVGFVFQEYNVLNEFNVEDNISLALELQGKTKEREKIARILEEVDLKEYAKRKPNTLSGGQKQRVAIARALVKDPQIIMADEPTGALDSATGKQVFETLKRLSKSRLVLVVSHDREFAETYADRIIELQDGKVILDVSKKRVEGREVSEGIFNLGDTLSLRLGKLSEEDFSKIRAFLENGEGEAILTRGKKEVESFRRVNRIEEGGREEFDPTPPAPEKREEKTTKFIRSRLPLGKAVKIGSSGLKLKPFRLVLTILLSVVSFVMFGLFSTMMFYDGEKVLTRSFLDSGLEYVTLEKRFCSRTTVSYSDGDGYTREQTNPAFFTEEEAKSFSKNAVGAYRLNCHLNGFDRDTIGYYLAATVNKAAYVPEGSSLSEGLTGTYPQTADEIAVSRFLFECFQNVGIHPADSQGTLSETLLTPQKPEDLIGQTLLLDNTPLKITAIFEGGKVPERYDRIKTFSEDYAEVDSFEDLLENLDDYILYLTYGQYISEGVQSLILTSEDFFSQHPELLWKDSVIQVFDGLNEPFLLLGKMDSELHAFYETAVYQSQPDVFFLDPQKDSLEDNEVILPLFLLYQLGELGLGEEQLSSLNQALDLFSGNKDERNSAIEIVRSVFQTPLSVPYGVYDWQNQDPYSGRVGTVRKGTVTVAGFICSDVRYNSFYCSESLYEKLDFRRKETFETNYVPTGLERYSVLLVPFGGSESGFRAIADRTGKPSEDDVVYSIGNVLSNTVRSANEIVETLSVVFLGAGLVLAVFSALLLFNFISMSISNKKKEIGILRAVGARGTDVFKIFFAESGIIVGICTVLALIGTFLLTILLNRILRADIGLEVTLFVFGPLPILVMIALALAVAVIATFLPVFFAARKKPVESIRTA